MSSLQLRQGLAPTPEEAFIAANFPLGQPERVRATHAFNRPKWRILIAEEHKSVREQLMRFISEQPDLISCGHGEDLASARAAIALYKPDLLIIDPSLTSDLGFELTNSLRAEFPGLRLLICSRYDEAVSAEKALQAGANGYIMKQESAGELLNAIRTVLSDKIYLGHNVTLKVLQRLLELKPPQTRLTA